MIALIRPATASDQPTISALVRSTGLNPFDLHWRQFLVAEDGGRIVGVGQVKPHGDSSRELASLVIVPERRGQGLGRQLVRALLAREAGPVYLFCREQLADYYSVFGFRPVDRDALPPVMARIHRLAGLMTALVSRVTGHREHIIAMRRGE